uniref:Uncharacterized protein n=1 Tax=Cynoglossus semilaevis TaxID=244447 RepID=A0A3P8X4S2_CYNSE
MVNQLLTFEPTSRVLARTLSSASLLLLLHLLLTMLQVFDGLLHVLLHTLQVSTGVLLFLQLLCHHGRSFLPAATLGLQRALQGVHSSLVVSLGLFHLFIFLRQLSLNLSFDLIEL